MKITGRGFTLIELLVVISIISLLASVVLSAVSSARAKGRDARRVEEMYSIKTAIMSYNLTTGAMPANQAPGVGYCDNQPNFLNELVSSKLLAAYPKSPAGTGFNNYCYYDYGRGNSIGALLVVTLEAASPSATGYPGTCRPFPAASNWCDQSVNRYYCLCMPY